MPYIFQMHNQKSCSELSAAQHKTLLYSGHYYDRYNTLGSSQEKDRIFI